MKQIIAILARTSKEYKDEERVSIDQQVDDGRRLAETLKLQGEIKVYLDPDRSGKLPPKQWATAKTRKWREGLTQFIADAEAGLVRYAIIRKRDRLCRDTQMALRFWDFLPEHNIELHATHETLPKGKDGTTKFSYTILAAASELLLSQISDNTKAGLARNKRKGKKVNGARDFGFDDTLDKKAVKNEREAALVNEMFDRLIDGQSLNSIGLWLTDANPIRQTGYKGCHVRAMLTNPHYIGMTEIDGKLEPSAAYPAIVDPSKYWKAQEILKARKGVHVAPKGEQEPHLLSGVVKCGCCGRNLQWTKFSQRGNVCYPLCQWNHPTGGKIFRMTETAWLEWAESFIRPSFKINHTPVANSQRALLLTKVGKIQENIEALQTKFAKGDLNADLLTKALEMATQERDKVQQALEALPPDKAAPHIPWAEMSFDMKREALLYAVEKITVHSDHVAVTYQKHTNRPCQTFPLMQRRPIGGGNKPLNCLTPKRLQSRDAWAVMTSDKATVNWKAYIVDRRGDREAYKTVAQFYYANADLANAAEPVGYGVLSRKDGTTNRRTFADALAVK